MLYYNFLQHHNSPYTELHFLLHYNHPSQERDTIAKGNLTKETNLAYDDIDNNNRLFEDIIANDCPLHGLMTDFGYTTESYKEKLQLKNTVVCTLHPCSVASHVPNTPLLQVSLGCIKFSYGIMLRQTTPNLCMCSTTHPNTC